MVTIIATAVVQNQGDFSNDSFRFKTDFAIEYLAIPFRYRREKKLQGKDILLFNLEFFSLSPFFSNSLIGNERKSGEEERENRQKTSETNILILALMDGDLSANNHYQNKIQQKQQLR
ncbi:hypothetical protein NH340_JMT07081 [Sarcoptes scabiei]|nr:hypothetical protein NH340_JMT07081 [Sarcoptes scabiei]